MTRSEQTTFLTLPPELRDKVYDEFFARELLACCIWTSFGCEHGQLDGVKLICEAIPDYRNEILPRFLAAIKSNPVYFVSEKRARDVMTDKFWSSSEFNQALKGTIFISDPTTTRAILDITVLYEWFGKVVLKDGYWCDGHEKQLLRDCLGILDPDVSAGRVTGTATCHSTPVDDRTCKVQGAGWELNIHLGLNPKSRKWEGEVKGDIWRLGYLHSRN